MADHEKQQLDQRLKSALWFSIGKIVDEETIKLGVNATPQFIGALTEMVWAQIGILSNPTFPRFMILRSYEDYHADTLAIVTENVSADLESFAKHAGRSTIAAEDVMLLSRRNEGLELVLEAYLDKQNSVEAKKGTR